MAGKAQAETASGLLFSTGIMGHLSESSVICKEGGTVVHAVLNSTVVSDPKEAFLPLTVDYRSRHYAFGKIPMLNSSRRERHGADDEVLVSRCIDRVVRPLFPKGYIDEVQILATCHAADGVHDPTIAAVNATSFALMQSRQPWFGPVGCVRVALIDGELQVDPSLQDMPRATLDLVYAGTKDRVLMVEAISDQVSEETVQQAMALANSAVCDIIGTQLRLLKQIEDSGVDSTTSVREKSRFYTVPTALAQTVHELGYDRAVEVYSTGVAGKAERGRNEGRVRSELLNAVMNLPEWATESALVRTMAVDEVMHKAFRAVLLRGPEAEGASGTAAVRADGRALDEVRPIGSAVEVLPSVHGSAYFARGDTHVLSTVTLGPHDASRTVVPIEGTAEEKTQPFMLHYDFPPYSTGELGNATAPNRRMVGHGNLAEKALRPVMPPFEEFPYAVRAYCECTGSNGSSSMASVCAGSLALFDAGVPLKAPVAGVSVGLVTDESLAVDYSAAPASAAEALAAFESQQQLEGRALGEEAEGAQKREFVVLRDLTGSEDHHGDMDYKIAGTRYVLLHLGVFRPSRWHSCVVKVQTAWSPVH
jgi:polyribonucleotide nucleotidyltransferase